MQQKPSALLVCLPPKFLFQAMYSASSRMPLPFPMSNRRFTTTVLSTQNVLFGSNKRKRKCPSLYRNPNIKWNHSLFSTGLLLRALPAALAFLKGSWGLVVPSSGLCLFLRMPLTRVLRSLVMSWAGYSPTWLTEPGHTSSDVKFWCAITLLVCKLYLKQICS